jgi:hypothetical protein
MLVIITVAGKPRTIYEHKLAPCPFILNTLNCLLVRKLICQPRHCLAYPETPIHFQHETVIIFHFRASLFPYNATHEDILRSAAVNSVRLFTEADFVSARYFSPSRASQIIPQ